MTDLPVWLPLAFFCAAFFYSLAGFGGGSSYLAFLVLAGVSYQTAPLVALICNLIVAGCGFFHYSKSGHFRFGRAWPFVLLSVPAAYIGGLCDISRELFCLLLSVSLACAALQLFLNPAENASALWRPSPRTYRSIALSAGLGLGFLSGLVGIGGGIFLSPFVILMRWMSVKEASALASFFIIVNSFAGLCGRILTSGRLPVDEFAALGAAALLGGWAGSKAGSLCVPTPQLRRVVGVLTFIVSVRLAGMWG